MPDLIDAANDLVDVATEDALRRVRNMAGRETHPDFDGHTCVVCGDDIPPARLAMGKVRCVICQGAIEHNRRT